MACVIVPGSGEKGTVSIFGITVPGGLLPFRTRAQSLQPLQSTGPVTHGKVCRSKRRNRPNRKTDRPSDQYTGTVQITQPEQDVSVGRVSPFFYVVSIFRINSNRPMVRCRTGKTRLTHFPRERFVRDRAREGRLRIGPLGAHSASTSDGNVRRKRGCFASCVGTGPTFFRSRPPKPFRFSKHKKGFRRISGSLFLGEPYCERRRNVVFTRIKAGEEVVPETVLTECVYRQCALPSGRYLGYFPPVRSVIRFDFASNFLNFSNIFGWQPCPEL